MCKSGSGVDHEPRLSIRLRLLRRAWTATTQEKTNDPYQQTNLNKDAKKYKRKHKSDAKYFCTISFVVSTNNHFQLYTQ